MLTPMPLFDFVCKSCQHEFETLVRPGSTPECPSCHGRDLERQVSTFAVDSAELRAASAKDARKRQIAKRKDSYIAEEEYRKKHDAGDI
jgi:putative FmdB family regulatory protein